MKRFVRGVLHALGRPRALLYVHVLRLLAAWVVASPLARTLSQGVASHPRGDAVLFDPGALELAEALRVAYPVLRSEVRGALLVGGVLAFLSLVPLAGLLNALCERERSGVAHWTARGIQQLPRFTLLGGATLLVQSLLGVAAALGIAALRRHYALAADERTADALSVAIALVALALGALAAVLQDLARARVVTSGASVWRAVRHAAWVLRHEPGSALVGWTFAATGGLVWALAVARLVGAVDLSRPGSTRIIVVTLLHQLGVLGIIALRAGWLRAALDLAELNAPSPASVDRSASSDAPADPSPIPSA